MKPKEFLTKKHPNFLNSCFHQADYFTVKKMLSQYRKILKEQFEQEKSTLIIKINKSMSEETKNKRGGAREGAGRKEVKDPKVKLIVSIHSSTNEKFKSLDKCERKGIQSKISEFSEKTILKNN